MELDVYLKTLKKEKDEWMESDVKPAARKRLERMLLLQELSKKENVQVEKEELQSEIGAILGEMQDSSDPKKMEKQLKNKNVANALTMEAVSRVMDRKVYERLKMIATGQAAAAAAEDKPAAKKTTKKTEKITETVADTGTEKPSKPKKTKSASAAPVTTEESQEKK
jgi:trigger factor